VGEVEVEEEEEAIKMREIVLEGKQEMMDLILIEDETIIKNHKVVRNQNRILSIKRKVVQEAAAKHRKKK
jgi:uncharacterized protein YrrD